MKRLARNKKRSDLREVRHRRVRAVLSGTESKPRLSVYRSLKGVTVQLIDDAKAKTLCYVNSRQPAAKKTEKGKVTASFNAGKALAEKAKAKGIVKVVFDRGGYKYHGRVKAVADGAREGGLQF